MKEKEEGIANLKSRVERVFIEKISPSLNMHGGDMQIIDLEKTKSGYDLKVVLQGACDGCGAAPITLQYLVQETIDENFPDEQIDVIPIYSESIDDLL